ncbi:MAG: peptidylprolyl isomerase [Pseudonocardiaceae bacterium]
MRTPLALALISSVLLAGCTLRPADPAATVDATAISRTAFAARISTVTRNADVRAAIKTDDGTRRLLRAGVLDQLINAALITEGAERLGVEVTDPELQSHIDTLVRTQLGGAPEAWHRYLDQHGYPEAEIRTQLQEDLRREAVEQCLLPNPVVTQEQVNEVYRKQYAGRPVIRHILLADVPQARRVLQRLAAGERFAALAAEVSLDTHSAVGGGNLGPHVEDAFVGPFEEAIENARDGQVLGPVQTPFGYHIIERQPPAALTEVQEEIRTRLAEQLQDDVFTSWLAQLRERARVDVAADIGHWDTTSGTVQP